MKGLITGIKRFAVHDGDGIRTTVFTKGCPLACVWCHNPEDISSKREIGYFAHKCRACGACSTVCEANTLLDGIHAFDRTRCTLCAKCTGVCPTEAFTLYGEEVEPEDLMPKILEDRDFYETSGGGLTVSGGECLMQREFTKELLMLAKKEGLNTAVDTCGFVPRAALEAVLPYTDTFLYDIKAASDDVHIKCTTKPCGVILDNLKFLSESGARIEIRIPFVPEYNSAEMEKIRDFLLPLKGIVRVKVLPYHDLAGSKYDAIGRKNTLPPRLPTKEEILAAEELFAPINCKL